jgi:deazaflavin-dependent oxidoreductase (nitroreductase family)
MDEARYVRPGLGARLFNRLPAALARLGISVYGARVLAVRGRRTGAWRTVPVNLLEHDGARYLVAPRGDTQWVRNLRATGTGELRLGRTVEAFRAVELPDDVKPPILRNYLRRWQFQVGAFFPGLGPDASDAELRARAAGYPVFRLDVAR